MMVSLRNNEGATMKHITPCLLLGTGLLLAGCGNMSSTGAGTGGAGGTARTVSGADAANADVKGSTSATGAVPANTQQGTTGQR
jgi:multidrug efflux pump subunit AcrA (membrane-fusion protein)